MPGKKAPDYFPLNLGMSGKGSYYGDVSPVLGYGKYDSTGLEMFMGSPMNTLTNNSPNTNAYSLSEFITINGIPPVNSEDEEEYEDDAISHSGSESISIQESDDLDVDIDDVDSLVLNIRDKLQMAPNVTGGTAGKCGHHWSPGGSLSNKSTSGYISPSSGNDSDDLILHHHCTSPLGFPNSSNNSDASTTAARRRRNPYSHVRSMNFNHRSSSNGASGSSSANKGHNSYYRRFHPNPPGSIAKAKSNSHQKNWWASSVAKGCSSSSITKQFSRTDDPYQLLQELLESGSLIKEAVRRLNRKCLNSSNGSNTNNSSSSAGSNNGSSISANVICSSTSSPGTTNISSNTRFAFIGGDEDTENSYPGIPITNHV